MNFHELKDIVNIYSSGPDGKPDYSWENAKISVWDSLDQREMDLTFVGSIRPSETNPGKIQFVAKREGDDCLPADVFEKTLKKIFPNISDETSKEYTKVFLQELSNAKKQ